MAKAIAIYVLFYDEDEGPMAYAAVIVRYFEDRFSIVR
jgi:hypothetical protein